MKIFNCTCKDKPTLFFESTSCNLCGRVTGLTDDFAQVQPFEFDDQRQLYYLPEAPNIGYRKCDNFASYQACNGMVRANSQATDEQQEELCFACRFNNTIPNLEVADHIPLWQKMETAKRRALYTLKELNLPLRNGHEHSAGITFDFTVDRSAQTHFDSALPNQETIFTGHNHGHITINLAEADEVARSKVMMDMGERYRTLLGHFRHELGHYYFDQIIAADPHRHALSKKYFGDDEQDYQQALDRHYQQGAPQDWHTQYISSYATMHPWEDWAETWAHYMHIVDTLETAQSAGLIAPQERSSDPSVSELQLPQDANYFSAQTPFQTILTTWMRFSVILNSLNRSMGLADAYPFVLTPNVREKLNFVHLAIHNRLHQLG